MIIWINADFPNKTNPNELKKIIFNNLFYKRSIYIVYNLWDMQNDLLCTKHQPCVIGNM